MAEFGQGLFGLIQLTFLVALYFLPAIVAYRRKLLSRYSIMAVNFFFGWTLIGWVVALAMAVSLTPQNQDLKAK